MKIQDEVQVANSRYIYVDSKKGSMKTVDRAANLFYSFRHMSALFALGTM